MSNLVTILALGFFLGMRHATDADHVIAVATIVARERSARSAAVIGAAWGLGHTLTILVVGGAIILLGGAIPPRVGMSMEMAVGFMLCVLGLLNLRGVTGWVRETVDQLRQDSSQHVHSHAHQHGDYVHTHAHGHEPESHPHDPEHTPVSWLDRHFGRIGAYQLVRPLVVGVVHGLAGSAAVALLVLATIQSSRWALLYLTVFGVGTIAGMMLITVAIGLPFAATGRRFARTHRGLRLASGAISLAFGVFVAYDAGLAGGLFGGEPRSPVSRER
jgi:ABC-type nickel/cobalt efflux system permease component RcnA